MQQRDQSDFVYLKALFKVFLFYLHNVFFLYLRVSDVSIGVFFMHCFLSTYQWEFFVFLPDVMRSENDGQEWK